MLLSNRKSSGQIVRATNDPSRRLPRTVSGAQGEIGDRRGVEKGTIERNLWHRLEGPALGTGGERRAVGGERSHGARFRAPRSRSAAAPRGASAPWAAAQRCRSCHALTPRANPATAHARPAARRWSRRRSTTAPGRWPRNRCSDLSSRRKSWPGNRPRRDASGERGQRMRENAGTGIAHATGGRSESGAACEANVRDERQIGLGCIVRFSTRARRLSCRSAAAVIMQGRGG